ncbi:MAG: carboxypeptidase regulatory-like domain-containing protein [Myxococcales bacterium]|nr:carboxypeptidase regulatory-like domain-containing protein [Myxococcales bacterium]
MVLLAVVVLVVVIGVRRMRPRGVGMGPSMATAKDAGGAALVPQALPTLPTPVKGPGDETLVALVVDGAGLPVGDVAVTAVPESAVKVGATEPAVAVVAVTGPDGHVELEGLVPGRYRVTLEGAAIFTSEVRYVPVPADVMRLVAARRVALAGVVTDGGQPAAGATVALDSDALYGTREVTAGADGKFAFDELPEGSYRVWAWRGDRAARSLRVPRLGRGPFADVTLALEPAAIVLGRVVDRQTGAGLAAAVTLSADAADEAPRHVRTDADGRFRAEGVPPGKWTASAWAPGWLLAGTVSFTPGRGDLTLELIPGGVVEGKVVDDTGAPVAGAVVTATGRGSGGLEVSAAGADEQLRRALGLAVRPALAAAPLGADAQFVPRGELGVMLGPIPFAPPPGAARTTVAMLTDADDPAFDPDTPVAPLPVDPAYVPIWTTGADGRFRLTGLPAGGYVPVAEAPGFAVGRGAPLTLALGQIVVGVELVLPRGAMVAGRVSDQRGAPVGGAIVRFAPAEPIGSRGVVEVATDADGNYRAGPLAGAQAVSARAWGHGDFAGVLDVKRPADGSDVPYDVTLVVADAELEGVVEDPAGLPVVGARIAIDAGAGAGRATVAGPGGRFRLTMLAAGPIQLRVEHPDYPGERATVTTGDAARVVLRWGGGLELVVFDHHTGANLPGLPVLATGPGKARRELSTDAAGRVRLTPIVPGAWTLAVRTPGYVARALAVTVPPGDRPAQITAPDLRLELERGATVTGVVRDRAGDRVAGVALTLAADADAEARATTDSLGEFRLRDVPTGTVTLRATKGGLRAQLELELRPGDERGGVDLTLE